MSPYESTAAELALEEHVPLVDFVKAWAPLGASSAASLSADDEARRRFWLDACVDELGGRFVPAPGSVVRALQIGECMQARGWHLVVQEAAGDRDAHSPLKP